MDMKPPSGVNTRKIAALSFGLLCLIAKQTFPEDFMRNASIAINEASAELKTVRNGGAGAEPEKLPSPEAVKGAAQKMTEKMKGLAKLSKEVPSSIDTCDTRFEKQTDKARCLFGALDSFSDSIAETTNIGMFISDTEPFILTPAQKKEFQETYKAWVAASADVLSQYPELIKAVLRGQKILKTDDHSNAHVNMARLRFITARLNILSLNVMFLREAHYLKIVYGKEFVDPLANAGKQAQESIDRLMESAPNSPNLPNQKA